MVTVPVFLLKPAPELQWGRGIDAAEFAVHVDGTRWYFVLQWGRGIDAAEFKPQARAQAGIIQLQWGRGIDAAEL